MQGTSWLPLHTASHEGNAKTVDRLLRESREEALDARTSKGDSALHLCSLGAHESTMRLLLEAGADANLRNHCGWTPLVMCALASAPAVNRISCIRALLNGRADPQSAAEGGWTTLLVSANRGDHQVLATLLDLAGPTRCEALLAARTAPGQDSALHLAAHAGSDLSVRLLLAAGSDAGLLNAQGLNAASLALSAAFAEGADLDDATTARFEWILERLVAATPQGSARRLGLMHTIVGAPRHVPLRRLVAFAVVLRRAGFDDAPEPAHPELPSLIATRCGRHALASLLRATQPWSRPLLCLRRPVEAEAPIRIVVHEGAVSRPTLRAEDPSLRLAVLRTMRSSDEAHRASGREAATDAAVAEVSEIAAEEAAAAVVGGPRVRWRSFRLVGELPYDDAGANGSSELPFSAAGLRSLKTIAEHRPPTEALPAAIMACLQTTLQDSNGSRVPSEPQSNSAGLLTNRRQPPVYTQRRRWAGRSGSNHQPAVVTTDEPDAEANGHAANGHRTHGSRPQDTAAGHAPRMDVMELEPQRGAPLLHDAHLQLLIETLGPAAIEDDGDGDMQTAQMRPWAVYAESSAEHAVPPALVSMASSSATQEGGDWSATAEVFSLETPLLLSFAVDAQEQASLAAAMGEDEDNDDDDDDDDDGEDPADEDHERSHVAADERPSTTPMDLSDSVDAVRFA